MSTGSIMINVYKVVGVCVPLIDNGNQYIILGVLEGKPYNITSLIATFDDYIKALSNIELGISYTVNATDNLHVIDDNEDYSDVKSNVTTLPNCVVNLKAYDKFYIKDIIYEVCPEEFKIITQGEGHRKYVSFKAVLDETLDNVYIFTMFEDVKICKISAITKVFNFVRRFVIDLIYLY